MHTHTFTYIHTHEREGQTDKGGVQSLLLQMKAVVTVSKCSYVLSCSQVWRLVYLFRKAFPLLTVMPLEAQSPPGQYAIMEFYLYSLISLYVCLVMVVANSIPDLKPGVPMGCPSNLTT